MRRVQRGFEASLSDISGWFPVLTTRLSQRAGTLSGGEQKMLIVARGLIAEPRLLLLDEVTEGLQPSVVDRLAAVVADELDQLRSEFDAVICASSLGLRIALPSSSAAKWWIPDLSMPIQPRGSMNICAYEARRCGLWCGCPASTKQNAIGY